MGVLKALQAPQTVLKLEVWGVELGFDCSVALLEAVELVGEVILIDEVLRVAFAEGPLQSFDRLHVLAEPRLEHLLEDCVFDDHAGTRTLGFDVCHNLPRSIIVIISSLKQINFYKKISRLKFIFAFYFLHLDKIIIYEDINY